MNNTALFLFCALVNLACTSAGMRYVVLEESYQRLVFLVSIAMTGWCIVQAVIA
jgi:hypothetical protein